MERDGHQGRGVLDARTRADQSEATGVIDLSQAGPATAAGASGDVQATISVGGDLSGQVAVGNNIVQVRIDTLHGNVVTAAAPQAAPVVTRRAAPVRLLPRRPAVFVDRAPETARILDTVLEADVVNVAGPAGTGKSALLRHVAHHPRLAAMPGGVVHLSASGHSADDLGQSLFDVFYETSAPYKPSRGELRQRMQDVVAAVLLDDVAVTSDEASALLDLIPRSGVVAASDQPILGATVRLGPLPHDDAVGLVRAVASVDGPTATRLAEQAGRVDPLRLLQATGQATGEADLAQQDRRVLGLLLAVPGLLLDERQVARMAGIDEPGQILERLADLGLAQRHTSATDAADRFGAAPGSAGEVSDEDLAAARRTVEEYFHAWAQRHRNVVRLPANDVDAARRVMVDAFHRERWALVAGVALAVESALSLAGRWDAWADTLSRLTIAAAQTGADDVYAFARHQQGVLALCTGAPDTAASLLQQALEIRERLGDRMGAEATRANLQLLTPPLPPPPRTPPSPPPSGVTVSRLKGLLGTLAAVGVAVGALLLTGVLPIDAGSPTPVTVPAVEGLAVEEAHRRLEEVGLAGQVSEVERNDETAGTVIGQNPDAGTQVAPDTTVRLLVARAAVRPTTPEPTVAPVVPVEVPDVIGLDIEEASARIEGSDLTARTELVESAEVPAGTVVGQDPQAGQRVDAGTAVTLAVAQSPAGSVPPVVGLTLRPDPLVFDVVFVNDEATAPLTVTNTGDGPLAVGSVTIDDTAAFTAESADCTGRQLAPAQSCTLTITFHPTEPAPYTTTLSVDHDGRRAATARITGTGMDPAPTASILRPPDGQRVEASQFDATTERLYASVTLHGEADDPQQGRLTGQSLQWTTTADEGSGGPATRQLGFGTTLTTRLYVPGCNEQTGREHDHLIRLVVTDDSGNTGEATITVTVVCPPPPQ